MNQIHYLVRSTTNTEGLVYPAELDRPGYYGFGGLFLMGSEEDAPGEEYAFAAIWGEDLIVTAAVRFRETKNFFQVEVKKIGSFIFYAQAMPKKYPYVGNVPELQGLVALRRMRSWKPAALDAACREHNFYFVGASPQNQ